MIYDLKLPQSKFQNFPRPWMTGHKEAPQSLQTPKIIQGERIEGRKETSESPSTRDGNKPLDYHLICYVWTEQCLIQASFGEPGDNQGMPWACWVMLHYLKNH